MEEEDNHRDSLQFSRMHAWRTPGLGMRACGFDVARTVVSILVSMHAIAREIIPLIRAHIRLQVSRMIAIDAARHTREGFGEREHTGHIVAFDHSAGVRRQHHGHYAEERQRGGPGLHGSATREGGENVTARLSEQEREGAAQENHNPGERKICSKGTTQ